MKPNSILLALSLICSVAMTTACQSESENVKAPTPESQEEGISQPSQPQGLDETPEPNPPSSAPTLESVHCEAQDLICSVKSQKLEEIRQVFEHEFQRYAYLSGLYLKKDLSGENPAEFFGIVDELIGWGRNELPQLELYVRSLALTHHRCRTDREESLPECKLPKEPLLRHLDMVEQLSRVAPPNGS